MAEDRETLKAIHWESMASHFLKVCRTENYKP